MEGKNRSKPSHDISGIGSNLKRWLIMRGTTLAEVSRKSKIPRSTLDSWITGARSPTVPHLLKLNFSTDFLIYGRPKPVLPYFGEDVTHPSEQELYKSAFRELVAALESFLRLETYKLALTIYRDEQGETFDERSFNEIHNKTIFSLRMITSFYFCLYFGVCFPIIVTLWFLKVLDKNKLLKNSAIHDIISRLSQGIPLIYYQEELINKSIPESIERFDLRGTLNQIEGSDELNQILEEEKQSLGDLEFLFEDSLAFFDIVVYRLDTALKVHKLPLVCLSHKIVFYGPSCPMCEHSNRFLLSKTE